MTLWYLSVLNSYFLFLHSFPVTLDLLLYLTYMYIKQTPQIPHCCYSHTPLHLPFSCLSLFLPSPSPSTSHGLCPLPPLPFSQAPLNAQLRPPWAPAFRPMSLTSPLPSAPASLGPLFVYFAHNTLIVYGFYPLFNLSNLNTH